MRAAPKAKSRARSRSQASVKPPKRKAQPSDDEEEEDDDDDESEEEEEEEEEDKPTSILKGKTRSRSQSRVSFVEPEWISPVTHTRLDIQQRLQALANDDLLELKVKDAQGILSGRVLVGIHAFAASCIQEGLALDAVGPIGSSADIQRWADSDRRPDGTWHIHLCCSEADVCTYRAPQGQPVAHFDAWRVRELEDLKPEEYFMSLFDRSVLKDMATRRQFTRPPKQKLAPPLLAMKAKAGGGHRDQDPPVVDGRMRSAVGPAQVPRVDPPSLKGGGGRQPEPDGAMRKVQELQERAWGDAGTPTPGDRSRPEVGGKKNNSMQELLMDRAQYHANTAPGLGHKDFPPAPPSLPEQKDSRSVFGAPTSHVVEEDGGEDSREKKRKKKRKSHRRRRRSSSSTSSSDSEGEAGGVFRFASNREAGHENAIQDMARRKPGKLLAEGMRIMAKHCDPSLALVGGTTGGQALPPAAMKYLRQILEVTQGKKLTKRDTRELETLATCLDHLAAGRLSHLGDVLMQRFKAVETATRDQSWMLAQQQELIPSHELGVSTAREAEVAAKQAKYRANLMKALRNERPVG